MSDRPDFAKIAREIVKVGQLLGNIERAEAALSDAYTAGVRQGLADAADVCDMQERVLAEANRFNDMHGRPVPGARDREHEAHNLAVLIRALPDAPA